MSYRASPIKVLQSYSQRDRMNYSPVVPVVSAFGVGEQNQRLTQVIYEKNLQISKLYEENNLIRKSYQQQILTYKKTIESLESQINDKQRVRDVQFLRIKQRFQQISAKQSQELRSVHTHQIEFLLKQIAQQRGSNDSLNLKLLLKDQQIQKLKQSYQRELSINVNEVNSLNHKLTKIQDDKNKEIKDLNSKRELEKSRTSGLISSRRENNNFMDKQVRKLNQQVLQKTLQIQGLSRDLNRQRKKFQDTLRSHSTAIKQIRQKYQQQIQGINEQSARVQKSLRLQLKQVKQQILGYIQQIDTLQVSITLGQKQVLRLKEQLQNKKQQVNSLKHSIQKQRQQHANQITNLMKQRRKSRSNIGSSRSIISLKESGVISDNHDNHMSKYDSQFGVSARLESNLHPIKEQSPDRAENKDYSRELADSHLQDQAIQTQLERAVYHYDNLIQQLKRNHMQELQLLKINQKKLRSRLQEKQHELLDILTKFSPLVKIHAGQKSLQEDRKQRIERHWKGDVALLDVLLRKYRIKVFQ